MPLVSRCSAFNPTRKDGVVPEHSPTTCRLSKANPVVRLDTCASPSAVPAVVAPGDSRQADARSLVQFFVDVNGSNPLEVA